MDGNNDREDLHKTDSRDNNNDEVHAEDGLDSTEHRVEYHATGNHPSISIEPRLVPESDKEVQDDNPADVNSERYLQSQLTFEHDRILDEDHNGVMMAWEDEIMKKTADLLCGSSHDPSNPLPPPPPPSKVEGDESLMSRSEDDLSTNKDGKDIERGKNQRERNLRILNVGYGMGIIDTYFQSYFFPNNTPTTNSTTVLTNSSHTNNSHPTSSSSAAAAEEEEEKEKKEEGIRSHHIIEAHPSILARMNTPQGGKWNEKPGVVIHQGRWQDILPRMVEHGMMFDVIYFDTFAEDYAALKSFFREYVVALLEPRAGRWSFFNGLGADRRVCYDVYTKVRLPPSFLLYLGFCVP